MIRNILSLLEETAGSNDKVDIIKQRSDDELFKRVLTLALSPYIQFYVRKIPEVTKHTGELSLSDALDALEELSSRKVSGHAALRLIETLLISLSEDDAVVLTRVLKKDLRCKVAASLVNKAIPKHVPKYPCLLAREQSEKNLDFVQYPAYSQLKSDGMRANIIYENDKIHVRGRSGKLINLKSHLDQEFLALGRMFGEPCVFDGELLVLEDDGSFCCRKKGNGMLNKAIVKEIPDDELVNVRVRVWDVIPLKDFKEERYDLPYSIRYDQVCCLMTEMSISEGNLAEVIPCKVIQSYEEAVEHYEECLAAGEEGTIIKTFDGPWENKRSKHLVKLKAEKECDLVVVGWKEGTGQFVGQIGSLICQSSDGEIEVDVGSGFSEEDRKQNPQELIGVVVAIRYNERITSKGKEKESLYLPRILEYRQDKSVADSSAEIK